MADAEVCSCAWLDRHRAARIVRVVPSESAVALRVLYQDESCAVVDKPSGMIVHRGWANDEQDLMRLTRDTLGRYVYPLHRLDRGASGAVLFALDLSTRRAP